MIAPQRTACSDRRASPELSTLSLNRPHPASKWAPDAQDSGRDEYSRSFWDKQRLPRARKRHGGHSSAARRPRRRENKLWILLHFISFPPPIVSCVRVFVLCPFVAALTRERDVVCLEFSVVTVRHYHISTSVSIYPWAPKKKPSPTPLSLLKTLALPSRPKN